MIEEILKKYKIKLKKNRDQFFLKNDNIQDFEVEQAEVSKKDVVLEIGAGVGTLTEKLAEKAKKVISVEIDEHLIPILNERMNKFSNIELINEDFLKLRIPEFDKCVSNIPYQISSKIIESLAKNKKFSVICCQKEFAERLIANPGERNYSRISILSNFYFTPSLVKKVSKGNFIPIPKVDSAIVKLIPKKIKYKVNEDSFFEVVSALFTHRNKKTRNAFYNSRHFFNLEKVNAKKIIENIPYSEIKVIKLTIENIIEIYNYLLNQKIVR